MEEDKAKEAMRKVIKVLSEENKLSEVFVKAELTVKETSNLINYLEMRSQVE